MHSYNYHQFVSNTHFAHCETKKEERGGAADAAEAAAVAAAAENLLLLQKGDHQRGRAGASNLLLLKKGNQRARAKARADSLHKMLLENAKRMNARSLGQLEKVQKRHEEPIEEEGDGRHLRRKVRKGTLLHK